MNDYIYIFAGILILSILTNAILYYKSYRLKNNLPKTKSWLSTIISKIDGMLMGGGDTKSWSSNRVAFIFSTILSDIVVWGGLAYLILTNQKFPDSITFELVTLYAIAKGISGATKVAQYVQEIKTNMKPADISAEPVQDTNKSADNVI